MDDASIHEQITDLVNAEHELRDRLQAGGIDSGEEHRQLQRLEQSLDQCWDLLRQRDARRSAGQNPDEAKARPTDQVENYRQ